MQKATNYCWGDDMRERRYLTFDMQNPRHIEAFDLFTAQPNKLGSEFVVNCILAAQDKSRLEEMIRQVVLEALKDVTLSVHNPPCKDADLKKTEDISCLPDVLIDSLNKFEP